MRSTLKDTMPRFIVSYITPCPATGLNTPFVPQLFLAEKFASQPHYAEVFREQALTVTTLSGKEKPVIFKRLLVLRQVGDLLEIHALFEAAAESLIEALPIPASLLAAALIYSGGASQSNIQWTANEVIVIPAPHIVTIVPVPSRKAICESNQRYAVLLNKAEVGELYFNMRGYQGYLPLQGGNQLDIGEKGISAFKKEAARINREAKAELALSQYFDSRCFI